MAIGSTIFISIYIIFVYINANTVSVESILINTCILVLIIALAIISYYFPRYANTFLICFT